MLKLWDNLPFLYECTSDKDVVSDEDAQEMAKLIGAKGYFETSAKTNTGVDELFEAAAKIVFEAGSNQDPGPCSKCVII